MRSLFIFALLVLNINTLIAEAPLKTDQKLRFAIWDKKDIAVLLKDKPVSELSNITILMVAAATGDYYAVKFLVENNIADMVTYEAERNIYTIPKNQSLELNALRDLLGDTFEPMLTNYLNVRVGLGRYIRAETDCGYTALTYAVVGGWENIVVYLVDEIEKKVGKNLLKKELDKKDCIGWTSILYAVAYKENTYSESNTPLLRSTSRENIFATLLLKGVDTKIRAGFEEGMLDIIGIAAKYNHPQIIKRLRLSYVSPLFMMDISEIKQSIYDALTIATYKNHTAAIKELNEWNRQLKITNLF